MATINVILLKSIKKSGRTAHAGDVLPVALGYFRYLQKKGLACSATKEALLDLEKRKQSLILQDEKDQEEAQVLLEKIANETFSLSREAGDNDVLYGSVTVSDVVRLLEEKGVSVPRNHINIPTLIKKLGTHTVTVVLHPKVITSISLQVTRR